MVLCDTNILIEFYKDNPHIVQELRLIGQDQLVISPITRAELYFGALNKVELAKLKKHLSSLHQLPLDVAISNMFLRLMETYSLSHKLNIVPKSIYSNGYLAFARVSGEPNCAKPKDCQLLKRGQTVICKKQRTTSS